MEEDPQDHDFDQRKDGPEQIDHRPGEPAEAPPRPSVHFTDRHNSEPLANTQNKDTPGAGAPNSPVAPARHSMQIAREPTSFSQQGRRSTQMSRSSAGRRTSKDFDVRRDGPFGRPSLTIDRRKPSIADDIALTPTLQNSSSSPANAGAPETVVGEELNGETPPSIETVQDSTQAPFEPEPPPLNYTLRTRKLSITIFWSLVVIDSTAMPIALYFGLWYGTTLSPNTVFSIVTAALGGVSILEYVLRFWRLWQKNSTCRVIGARRMYLDWFHWNFSLAWFVIMLELIIGTVFPNPPIRLLSMPLTTMCYVFGTELLIVDILRYFRVPAPLRVSSIPKGSQLRPCIYSVIEDVIAVDGGGGTQYREDLNRRYEASHVFRTMLRRVGIFWAVGAESVAVVTTILVFTLDHDPAYVIGWSLPFVWAGVWVIVTFRYVKHMLKKEKEAWAAELAAKSQQA